VPNFQNFGNTTDVRWLEISYYGSNFSLPGIMATKVHSSIPDSIASDLDLWAAQEGRSLSSLIAFLIETGVREARSKGEFQASEPTKTVKRGRAK
jgi:hypothetical protein